ncbi:hypothetical protein [Nitrosopumilus sp.]|uniref:hypothetical protein n=1 Tax=Nitrosopumilus sp. TaxID=2024843 RepID=UPI00247D7082|nr:hypothetical protein [Nitrosopumilus sp.]MCV0431851.1 hypothetical protein [Nitrosopumilus sp.]
MVLGKQMKTMIIVGIFLVIFSVDGFLFLDSSIPECKGFTGMGWFVFVHLGFEPKYILSNTGCLTSFYAQTGISVLCAIGIFLILYPVIKRQKEFFVRIRK